MARLQAEIKPRLFSKRPEQRPKENTSHKETPDVSPIIQFSMGIACLEEGKHIDRMLQTLASSPIPSGTDFLVVISDNGSRGAWQLIEKEARLTEQRRILTTALASVGLEEQFQKVLGHEEKMRQLELIRAEGNIPPDYPQQVHATANHRNEAINVLTTQVNPDLQRDIISYSLLEDGQRTHLRSAMQDPQSVIAQADLAHPPLLPDTPPSPQQLDTIRAFARVFLGKYDIASKNLRIGVVQGSETGSFGSVKRYALEAIKKDFREHHPDAEPKDSVIMIGDMDTHITPSFVENTIGAFATHPQKNALLANTYLVEEDSRSTGDLALRRLPIPNALSRIFMDQTNMRDFIHELGRSPGQLLPEGPGRLKALSYHLHPGPALIFRGDVFEKLTIPTTDGQGEDIALTMRYQRTYGTERTLIDPDTSYGFNLRGHDLFGYLLNPRKAREFLRTRRDAITPYQHIRLEKSMSPQKYREFLDGIQAHMKRRLLLRDIIRQIEQESFDLRPHDYILDREQTYGSLKPPQLGESVKCGYNDLTGQKEWALIGHAPQEVALTQHEFISGEVTDRQLHHLEKGERVVTAAIGLSPKGERIVKHFLVATHLPERDFATLPFTFAETLTTHTNGTQATTATNF